MRRLLVTMIGALSLLATGVVAGLAAGGTGTVEPPPRIAFLANGRVPADALAAGPVAGRLGAPLFTTEAERLVTDAQQGIEAFAPELVIVMGGPVAISDAVVSRLADVTALPVLDDDQVGDGVDGIVRVAGGDRFATAAAVAALVDVLRPGFLPVDATALGALAADRATTAGDADTLGGFGAQAFALAGRSCGPGEVMTGIASDGEPDCGQPAVTPDDATVVAGRLRSTAQVRVLDPQGGGNFARETLVNSAGVRQSVKVEFAPPMPVDRGVELVDVTICTGPDSSNLGSSVFMSVFDRSGASTNGNALGVTFADDTCTTVVPGATLVIDRETRLTVALGVVADSTAFVRSVHATFAPTG